jgi:hypothetical protein
LRIQILVDNILPGLPEFDTQATAQTLPSGAEASSGQPCVARLKSCPDTVQSVTNIPGRTYKAKT